MGFHDKKTFRWNEDRLTTLRGLLLEGRSASDIGAHFGVTRNVIVGKVFRDKSLPRLCHIQMPPRKQQLPVVPAKKVALPQQVSLAGGKPKKRCSPPLNRGHDNMRLVAKLEAKRRQAGGRQAPPLVVYRAERFQEGYHDQWARITCISLLKEQHCRFPIDLADGRAGYCGDVKEDHSSYCSAHAARCFNPGSAAMRKRLRAG